VSASKTKSWKKAAPAIAKREASKIIIFRIFMLIVTQCWFDLNVVDNLPVKYEKQVV
jgi:hypothetical protein